MRASLRWLLLAVLPACAVHGPLLRGAAAPAVRAAVEASWHGHIDGAMRKDLDAVMAMYADDVVYVVDGNAPVVGRADLRAMEQRGMATGAVLSAQHAIEALRVDGDLAYELGLVRGQVAPAGQPPATVVFHFVALWRQGDDGAWRVAHLVGQVEAAPAPRD